MHSTTIKRRMKPVLYPQVFLENKLQSKWQMKDRKSKSICLTKYFPKYYQYLHLYGDASFDRSLQFKIKQLKIVKEFYSRVSDDGEEKTLKKLFRSCRKTLKRLPFSYYLPGLCLYPYFPRVNTINLRNYKNDNEIIENFIACNGGENLATTSPLFWKLLKRFCAHFWGTNQFVETFYILYSNYSDLLIVKKLNGSMRFLSFLNTLNLLVRIRTNRATDLLIQLRENKNFLRHVTHLRIEIYNEANILDWELVQSIINCCPQVFFLSFPITYQFKPYQSFGKDLSLNLNCFPKLQALEIDVYDLETFIKRVEFSHSIQEVTLKYFRFRDRPKEIFCFRDLNDGNEDAKDWESFEQYNFIASFFEKWKEQKNLKVLNLKVYWIENMDVLMKMFILPLLRVNSQLETLNCEFGLLHGCTSEEDKLFDLDIFFEGIKSLRSLKILKINPWYQSSKSIAIYTPQKPFFLPRLSLLDISFDSFLKFDGSEFFKGIFHSLKSHPRSENIKIHFSKIQFYSAEELIGLAKILSQTSQFQTLEITLQGRLYVQNADDFISNSRFLRNLPKNAGLQVCVYGSCPERVYDFG